jgi:hypothetical protein
MDKLNLLVENLKKVLEKPVDIRVYNYKLNSNDLDSHILNKRCRKTKYAVIIRIGNESYNIIGESEISKINNTEEGVIKMSDKQTLYYSNNKDNLYKLIKNSIKND